MDKTSLGDRMKMYESQFTKNKLIPRLPVIARLDGRSFSKFTKGMERPFDVNMTCLMHETTKYLVGQTHATCGYTQSDEITLAWLVTSKDGQMLFNGKVDKLNSSLASMATAKFNHSMQCLMGVLMSKGMDKQVDFWCDKADMLPTFDGRIWNVPDTTEGANAFLWRELDATKNSISMASQSMFSHKELQGKHQADMQDMMHSKGVNWNDYPTCFKRGSYFKRVLVERKFTEEELANLPEKHQARKNPDLMITRSEVQKMKWEPLMKMENRESLIFDV